MTMEDGDVIRQKIDYFFKLGKPVHIKYKKEHWKNGHIKEISSDFFMIDEFMDGELAVFFLEIYEVEEYTKDFSKIEVGDGKGDI